MRTLWILVAGATLFGTAAAAQTCPGDLNRDNSTSIDEVVVTVDAALNGCPPELQCPFAFDLETPDGASCNYLGRWSPLCGDAVLPAFFISVGDVMGVSFPDIQTTFFADVVDAQIAFLFGWLPDEEPLDNLRDLEGEVLLSDSNGDALTVAPDQFPFLINDCDFERYEGRIDFVAPDFPAATAAGAAGKQASVSEQRLARVKSRVRELGKRRTAGSIGKPAS